MYSLSLMRYAQRALLIFLLGVTLSAAGGTGSWAKERIHIGLWTWPAFGHWYVIKEQNLAPNLDIEITLFEDPYEAFSLMTAGKLDVFAGTIEVAPITAEQRWPVKLVSMTEVSYGTDRIIVRPEIKKPEDLKGKKVAALVGGLAHIMTAMWLERNGVDPNDVEIVNLIMDDAVSAMINGSIAAAEFWWPFGDQVLKAVPGSRVVANAKEPFWLEQGIIADALFMHEDMLNNPDRRDAAVELMRAYYDAKKWWRTNTTEANKFFAKSFKYKVEDVEAVIGGDGKPKDGGLYVYDFLEEARFCGVVPGDPPFKQVNGQIYKVWRMTNDWWLKLGLMKKRIPAARGIDCSLQRELYETGYAGDPEPNY